MMTGMNCDDSALTMFLQNPPKNIDEAHLVYINTCNDCPNTQRAAALCWINLMDSREFEDRLKNNTLPEFTRQEFEGDEPPPLVQITDHPCRFMSEEEHEQKKYSLGYVNKWALLVNSISTFKLFYYYDDYMNVIHQ
jgi:hypothetical protein